MSKLILTRHGQSVWNADNKFTGWVDVDLSDKGREEAKKSGELLNKLNIKIDISYTSYLKRAIETLTIILKTPPPMAKDSKYLENFSPLNGGIPQNKIPLTESLKNTYDRVVPYYDIEINKNLKNGKNILVSAHGNSLRALCKYLFKISDTKINELEIPTGNPLIIEFDNQLKIIKYYYLDDTRAKNIIFNQ